jgi:hypothetical protein
MTTENDGTAMPERVLVVGGRKPVAEEALDALGIVKRVYLGDLLDGGPVDQVHPELVKAADRWQARNGAAGVVATSDGTLMTAAHLRSRYGLPGPGLDETVVGTNKLRMRQATVGAVRAPRAWSIRSFLAMRPDEIGVNEVVVKPLTSSSSRGVRRMSVPAAQEWLAGATEFCVVEEAIHVEQELHAEGLAVNGELVWLECSAYDRPVLSAQRGVRTSLILPAADPLREPLREMTQAVLTAMAVTTSVFHMEFLVQNGELYFGEVGLRPAGSGLAELLDVTLGSGLWKAHLSSQVGVEPRDTTPTRAAPPLTGLVMARLAEDGYAPLAQADAERLPGVIGTRSGTLAPGQAPPHPCASEYSVFFTGLERAGLDDLIGAVRGQRA